jgi:membrane-associated phospholipid phosphatase
MRSRLPRRYVAVLVVALLAILVGSVGPVVVSALASPSAKDLIAADPPPRLFPDPTVAPLEKQVTAQATQAHALMRQWWTTHDHAAHDAAFTAWLEKTLPGPPSAPQRTAEVADVSALARTRTPAGVHASTWLETHGKKDVWKLFAHDQAEVLSPSAGDARKQAVKDLLKLSKTVADTLGTKYQQSAPYVLHPSLRPDHVVAAGQVCPCSYPSRHAAAGAAATTYLSSVDPHRAPDYQWMQAEIDYSRVYMAGHTVSDVTGGALLGDMIGEYFSVTRR